MYENRQDVVDEVLNRFTLTCKKCGSTNVRLSVIDGWCGTDVTGGDPGEIAIGCNDCKQNDYSFSL